MYIQSVSDLGSIIRKQRKSLKLTQTQVAERCNTGVRFIVDLENGKPTIQMGKAIDLARALGIQIKLDIYNVEE